MDNLLYLLGIRISGIKNIKNEVKLDFYKKTITKDFEPNEYRIKAIYGENGSGKSALVSAVKIFKNLIDSPNYLSESANQSTLKEIINKETQEFQMSCEFCIHIPEKIDIYRYSVCLGTDADGNFDIKSEMLERKNGNYQNNKYRVLYECHDGELIFLDQVTEAERDLIISKTKNLLSRSVLSSLMVYQHFNYMRSHINSQFFMGVVLLNSLTMFMKIYMDEKDQHEMYFATKRFFELNSNENLNAYIVDWIYKSAIEFSGVNDRIINKENFDQYVKDVGRLEKFIKIFKSDLVSIEVDKKDNGVFYNCELVMNYGNYKVNKEFESTGIKKLIRLYECFAAASENGIVFIDEMDSNLNDVYLCKLIEYFMYYGKGQLCFTTHNLDPMRVLKYNKNSIDFLSIDGRIVSWTLRGNANPEHCYRDGFIEGSPFNIDATDFIGVFGE